MSKARIYLSDRLAALAALQARQEELGLSAWVNMVVEERLVQLGEEAHRAGPAAGAVCGPLMETP